jgi:hypothetical protein
MAHVHNLTVRYRAFGEKVLTTYQPGTERYLGPVATNVWNDYVIARLSASTAPPGKVLEFIPSIGRLRIECSSAVAAEIAAYRRHGDLNRLMTAAIERIDTFLCKIAEALGHADGGDPALREPLLRGASIAGGTNCEAMIDDMATALRRMFRYYPEWNSIAIYDDLKHVVRSCAFMWGIALRDLGKRVHITVL